MTKTRTQCDKILGYLKQGRNRKISSLQAIKKFGITRLAARISDLRKRGVKILSEYVTENGSTFKKYYLSK